MESDFPHPAGGGNIRGPQHTQVLREQGLRCLLSSLDCFIQIDYRQISENSTVVVPYIDVTEMRMDGNYVLYYQNLTRRGRYPHL